MKPQQWDRLQEIYYAALEKPSSERIAFIERECAGDLELSSKLKSMVKAHDSSDWILGSPICKLNFDDIVGTTIGERYFIERELEPGGMSQVYLAQDLRLQPKTVILKTLSRALAHDEFAQQRFKQEVEALLRLDHQNVIRVQDSDRLPDGRPYFVMPNIVGKTLRSEITTNGMDLKRVASILRQIGSALTHVHENGICHRDLKPENIILKSGTDSVVLIDFGIARVNESLVDLDTLISVSAGTPPYMSPEQHRHEKEITPASDVYSMGVVAYEMIFGERPFNPVANSDSDWLELLREGIGKFPPKLSTTAQHLLRRALSFDPQNRNRSAKDFGDKLADALLPPTGTGIPLWPVARVFGALLILAGLSFGFYKYWSWKDARQNRTFTYWLMVQERDGKDYTTPRKSNGEEPFRNGDKFQLNVETPVSAYLYVFEEGSQELGDTNFRMIYPNQATNNGSAGLGPDQSIQSDWMTFPDTAGTENFWFVWSLTPVPQLESAKTEAFKHPGGGLTDQPLIAVKEFLQTKKPASVWHFKAEQNAKPREKSDLIIALAQFKHR